MEKKSFDALRAAVKTCGDFARAKQPHIQRNFKTDGSVLTEVDLTISDMLVKEIAAHFPDCNVITEEDDSLAFDENAPYTFIFDPIDGTDSYSQGMPSWCIGAAILNRKREPAGSIIYAPAFGKNGGELFFWTAPDSADLYLNGEKLVLGAETLGQKDRPRHITTGSDIVGLLDLSVLNVKFKAFGSSLLHIVSTIVFCAVDACINPPCYVWDIAPAHALIKKAGLDYEYADGQAFGYDDDLLIGRKKFPKPLIIGTESGRKDLIRRLNGGEDSHG